MSFLNASERRSVFEKTLRVIDKHFMGPEVDTNALRMKHEEPVLNAEAGESFEVALSDLLKDLGASHTGVFHESRPRAAGRIAMAATLMKADTATDGPRWVFQDVHPGGVAAAAGIAPGDVLVAIDGQEVVPPVAIPFQLGQSYTLTVRKVDGSTEQRVLALPGSHEKKRPMLVPGQVVTARQLEPDIGYLRVSMFPGILGMDVARDMSRAVQELGCGRLIVDLRGNTGGGIGCLRLMSLLCPDRRGVGYSVGKKPARKGYEKERLPALDRIPSSKLGVLPLIVRFAGAGRSVAVYTEALGTMAHHGKVVLLVNEHSASAAEMVAAFASENGLATLVGTKTPGRLVAASAFKVGSGYRVALPVAAYYTWQGTNLEGRGVEPHVIETMSPEDLWSGQDNQLERAKALAEASP